MNFEQQSSVIEQMVGQFLETHPGYFLVEVRIKPTSNVKVFLDADSGVSIDKCVECSRFLYKKIEEKGVFPNGDFSLEVSSPGLDEPLKLHRQYLKNLNRHVEVLTKDGLKIEGKLTGVDEKEITIEETSGKGKKQTVKINHILFDQIRHTRIAVVF